MPAHTTVAQVDVGGMKPDRAVSALKKGVADRLDEPLVASYEDQTFEMTPAEIGLALDPQASIAAAGGERSWNPTKMLALVFGGGDEPPVLKVDETALKDGVGSVAETVDTPVTEALISFPDAKPEARRPKAGEEVDRRRLASLLRESYLMRDESIDLPVDAVKPAVDDKGLDDAMKNIAKPAVSAPVRLTVGEQTVDLPVTAYTPALTVEVVDGEMTPKIDPKTLREPLADATDEIGEKAVDAVISIENDKPVITPSETGLGVDPTTMSKELLGVLTKTGEERAISVEATEVEPEFTTEDAKKLRITEKISEFTTNYPHADYRNINQGRAAEMINGTVLKPGETFSFNDTVGERTEANGFTTGSVINGGVFRDELGGGVSQVVTTAYNAAFFAGLEDVEHHPHAFYIDRYPVGREATVYYGSLDLRFKNTLKNGVLIRAFVNRSSPGSQGAMTVQMWGTKQYDVKASASPRRNFREPGTRYDDTNRCVPQAPITGFDIDIHRTFFRNGEKVKTETDTANYQAADRVICGPKP